MSRPEDIPQDIWDAAEAVGEAIYGRHERGWVMWPLVSEHGNPAQEIVARAILAAKAEEREACAELADAQAVEPDPDEQDPYDDYEMGCRGTARRLAAAIRKRGEVNTAHKSENQEA